MVSDRDEQFRQYQASHYERQTAALERTARYVKEIRTVIEVCFGVLLIAAVILVGSVL